MSLESDYIAAINAGDDERAAAIERELAADPYLVPTPPSMAAAVAWYASVGVPIFPIVVGGKRPLLPRAHSREVERLTCRGECGEDGHGLYDATADLDRLKRWWTREPNANIGMPTGLAYDVIDIDGPVGVASMFNELALGGCLADSYTILGRVRTARDGGWHLYIPPAGRINGTQIYPDVDYRGEGGYVLLPPSIVDGRVYTWVARPSFGA